jgi:anti-sigma regulatory factor (Ser/Thr protein kinase)
MDLSQTRSFPGCFSSLDAISQFFTDAAITAKLGPRAIHAVQLAVEEASSNIIEHAYGGEGHQPIDCAFHVTDHSLTITFHDYGQSFDPHMVTEPDRSSSLEDRNVGGLGLYFIRQLMDEVRFQFESDAGNTLTMVKYRERPS